MAVTDGRCSLWVSALPQGKPQPDGHRIQANTVSRASDEDLEMSASGASIVVQITTLLTPEAFSQALLLPISAERAHQEHIRPDHCTLHCLPSGIKPDRPQMESSQASPSLPATEPPPLQLRASFLPRRGSPTPPDPDTHGLDPTLPVALSVNMLRAEGAVPRPPSISAPCNGLSGYPELHIF